jgi:hypothetical protein
MNDNRKWDLAAFPSAAGPRVGSAWGRWGIAYARRGKQYTVYLVGGGRLTEFDSLRCARRFCEAIDGLADWSRPQTELSKDRALGLALHRLALKITGGRPDLRLVPEQGAHE